MSDHRAIKDELIAIRGRLRELITLYEPYERIVSGLRSAVIEISMAEARIEQLREQDNP